MTESVALKDELRSTFLFESLTDEQLDWLVEHGTVENHPAGVTVYTQGDSAEAFYVLLDGEIELVKRMDGTDVVLSTTSQPGSYAGVMRAFITCRGPSPGPPASAPCGTRGCSNCRPTISPISCRPGSRWRCTCSTECSWG